jgi:hypothetical protein
MWYSCEGVAVGVLWAALVEWVVASWVVASRVVASCLVEVVGNAAVPTSAVLGVREFGAFPEAYFGSCSGLAVVAAG